MAKLIDRGTGEERQLIKPVTLIGRADYCDVRVPDRTISREHARIRRRITGYYIEDLGSTHGTRLNGVRVRGKAKLRDGDVIAIGAPGAEAGPSPRTSVPHTDTTVGPSRPRAGAARAGHQENAPRGACLVFHK